MKLEKRIYEARSEKRRDFWIGFGGWFGINIVLLVLDGLVFMPMNYLVGQGILSAGVRDLLLAIGGPLLLLINVGGLIGLLLTRLWVALGALAAIGAALLFTLIVGLIGDAIGCF